MNEQFDNNAAQDAATNETTAVMDFDWNVPTVESKTVVKVFVAMLRFELIPDDHDCYFFDNFVVSGREEKESTETKDRFTRRLIEKIISYYCDTEEGDTRDLLHPFFSRILLPQAITTEIVEKRGGTYNVNPMGISAYAYLVHIMNEDREIETIYPDWKESISSILSLWADHLDEMIEEETRFLEGDETLNY